MVSRTPHLVLSDEEKPTRTLGCKGTCGQVQLAGTDGIRN